MEQGSSTIESDPDLPPCDASSDPKPPTPPARVVLYLVTGLLAAFILLSVTAYLFRPEVGTPAEVGESARRRLRHRFRQATHDPEPDPVS